MASKTIYDEHRSDERLKFITKGQLDIDGTKYDCSVDDISTVGAAIKITSSNQRHFHVGELGTLNVLLLSPVKYLCRIVRIDTTQIGVQFVDN